MAVRMPAMAVNTPGSVFHQLRSWACSSFTALTMSIDIKYIGMDVRNEVISIAPLDGTGKLVMESIHFPWLMLIRASFEATPVLTVPHPDTCIPA